MRKKDKIPHKTSKIPKNIFLIFIGNGCMIQCLNVLMSKSILVFEAFSVVNIALKKPSELSSMYEPPHYECCDSDYAVDGYIHDWVNGDFFCAHTDHVEDKQEWWSVDLQDVYTIDYTYIYGRTDCCGK